MRTWVLGLAAVAVITGGCGRRGLDRIPAGSLVDVVTHDGVVLRGRLIEVRDEVVRLAPVCDDRSSTLIARTEVARVVVNREGRRSVLARDLPVTPAGPGMEPCSVGTTGP